MRMNYGFVWYVCVFAVKPGRNDLVVCFGELLIDFVPTVGGVPLADAPAFKKAPGGAPANVACGIAKLGGNSAFVGKVCHVLPDILSKPSLSNLLVMQIVPIGLSERGQAFSGNELYWS